jgi:phosphatidylinositol glycan class N
VDRGIKQVVERINGFYNDDATAFVFTADHGMSNIGNHGDGNPDNTRTPLIAWGAGIRKPLVATHDQPDGERWGIRAKRNDVMQADIAPLMVLYFNMNVK